MKGHNFLRSALAGSLFVFAMYSTGVHAQSAPSNEELGRRVDAMEGKIDKLIEMMSQMKSGDTPSAQSSVGAQANESTQQDFVVGTNVNLYLVPVPKKDGDIAIRPMGEPVASGISSTPTFDWADFLKIPAMKQFSMPIDDKRVGIEWTGYLQIPDAGPRLFGLDIVVDEDSVTTGCAASLSIDDVPVVEVHSFPPQARV